MPELLLLFESASGYALLQQLEFEEVGEDEESVHQAILDPKLFSKMVKLKAFLAFETAEEALEEMNSIADGAPSERLLQFLTTNLPKKSKNYKLGVSDKAFAEALTQNEIPATISQSVKELLRGVRTHFARFTKGLDLDGEQLQKAQLGLGHAYSRNKMQFDPNRQDKPILNTIALLDGLDKNINTFAMRVREWYAWHFPELTKLVTDNCVYAKVVKLIRVRDEFDCDGSRDALAEITDEDVADNIIKALKISMGQDIVEYDMQNIDNFADQVVKLSTMRTTLSDYLKSKMDVVAPNLRALIGETVGARLIAHAGSLTNLAKYPASTVQILGAEKALFRALKTKGNTPKYGLIFHSTFIGRAAAKNKGRISRYLANKCSLASRIDCFSSQTTNVYGEKMKDQVEERLLFLSDGTTPRRNLDVMQEAAAEVAAELAKKAKKKKKKKAAEEEEEEEAPSPKKKRKAVEEVEEEEPVPKKKKKAAA
jgi:nucleolar protein 56